jgi:hypothetical protein
VSVDESRYRDHTVAVELLRVRMGDAKRRKLADARDALAIDGYGCAEKDSTALALQDCSPILSSFRALTGCSTAG